MVMYRDGDLGNAHVENLYWGTKSAFKSEVANVGEAHHNAKLSEMDVLAIRYLYTQNYSSYEIADRFNVTHANIIQIVNRKTWKHI